MHLFKLIVEHHVFFSRGAQATSSQSSDYMVGSVSGSLFLKEASSSSRSLAALFSSAPPAKALIYVRAVKVSRVWRSVTLIYISNGTKKVSPLFVCLTYIACSEEQAGGYGRCRSKRPKQPAKKESYKEKICC